MKLNETLKQHLEPTQILNTKRSSDRLSSQFALTVLAAILTGLLTGCGGSATVASSTPGEDGSRSFNAVNNFRVSSSPHVEFIPVPKGGYSYVPLIFSNLRLDEGEEIVSILWRQIDDGPKVTIFEDDANNAYFNTWDLKNSGKPIFTVDIIANSGRTGFLSSTERFSVTTVISGSPRPPLLRLANSPKVEAGNEFKLFALIQDEVVTPVLDENGNETGETQALVSEVSLPEGAITWEIVDGRLDTQIRPEGPYLNITTEPFDAGTELTIKATATLENGTVLKDKTKLFIEATLPVKR